jgi:uncharacterized protein (DUF427 family)
MGIETGHIEDNPRWIRGYVGDRLVVDSRRTLLVWEVPYYPQWYVPTEDVAAELRPTGGGETTPERGRAVEVDLVLDDGRERPAAGWRYDDPTVARLGGRVRFRFDALDRWLEEDEEVIVHPRSPYVRVDALASSRRVVVRVGDRVVADSTRPTIVYETGLIPRYYLPPADVDQSLLTPTDTATSCPYKGTARYWSVTVDGVEHTDVVWGYDNPLPESAPIAGLQCFYGERLDLSVE